jgi:hypothetical protein
MVRLFLAKPRLAASTHVLLRLASPSVTRAACLVLTDERVAVLQPLAVLALMVHLGVYALLVRQTILLVVLLVVIIIIIMVVLVLLA